MQNIIKVQITQGQMIRGIKSTIWAESGADAETVESLYETAVHYAKVTPYQLKYTSYHVLLAYKICGNSMVGIDSILDSIYSSAAQMNVDPEWMLWLMHYAQEEPCLDG